MQRTIAHIDLDTFFVSCERLLDSRLIGKPVLIGGVSDRGVVAACSYEARAFGVHSAMPMKMARELCPDAIFIKGNSATYMEKSQEVTEIIRENVPLFEKSSVDEFYIDLTGTDRFFGSFKMMSEVRQKIIKDAGLPVSFGLSENKTVSKIATGEAKTNPKYDHQLKIDFGLEKPFLAPLSVKKIPMVGEKSYRTLCGLGIKKIKTIQDFPVELMQNALGKNGITLWKKANGIDESLVVPYTERKSISTERTFDRDTIDVDKLKSIIIGMTENLALQLRRGQKVTSCISVKIRYSDFSTHSLQQKLPYTSADHILIDKINQLFAKLYSKRLLVRLIGVKFSNLADGFSQINMFDDSEKQSSLYQAMDFLRDRYGDRSVVRAAGMGARTIGRGNPFTGEPPALLPNRRA